MIYATSRHLKPGKATPTRFTGGWEQPRAGLEEIESRENLLHLPWFELRTVQAIASRYPGPKRSLPVPSIRSRSPHSAALTVHYLTLAVPTAGIKN